MGPQAKGPQIACCTIQRILIGTKQRDQQAETLCIGPTGDYRLAGFGLRHPPGRKGVPG